MRIGCAVSTNQKQRVAFTSILFSVFVTALKILIGVLTNSIAILSEALHSGIDLIAVVTTFFAVKKADKPPDRDHLYGHGKVESLSSLAESILLVVICFWILFEVYERLFVSAPQVEINAFAILTMVVAIIVDLTRSRVLSRAAKRYNSKALEADAVHFTTDLLSSSVVMVGLILTFFGVTSFDSYAAIVVVAIIFLIAFRLGKKSINSLMDVAPPGMVKLISEIAMQVEGIEKVENVRVRDSGAGTFIDITAYIDKVLPLEVAHTITDELSKRIQESIPNSDVVVHAEPLCVNASSIVDKVRNEASSFPQIKNVHKIRIYEIDNKTHVEFHLEMDGELPLDKAHQIATELESRVKKLDAGIRVVSSHLEPVKECVVNGAKLESNSRLKESIIGVLNGFNEIKEFSNIYLKKINGKYELTLSCKFPKQISVHDSHEILVRIEDVIKTKLPEISSVIIHSEPEA